MTRAMPLAYSSPGASQPVPAWLIRVTYLSAFICMIAFAIGRATTFGVDRPYANSSDMSWMDRFVTLLYRIDLSTGLNLQLIGRVLPLVVIVPAYVMMLRCKRRGIPFPLTFRIVPLLALGLASINGMLPWEHAQRWIGLMAV